MRRSPPLPLLPLLALALLAGGSLPAQTPEFIRGDTNADGAIGIVDAIVSLGYLFAGGAVPPCLDAVDADDNGAANIVDPIHLLTYLFVSGPPPLAPFPLCGSDPTPDPLGCAGPVPSCPTNLAPVIVTSPPLTATEGVPYAYDVDASDPDAGDVLTYSLPAAPGGATIDPMTGEIAWVPDGGQIGLQPFVVRATDLGGLFAEQAFEVDVASANDAPTITSSPVVTATEGLPYAYDVEASDPDIGDALEYTLPLAPAGATIDPASGLIAWTPSAAQLGLQAFVVRATDLGGLFAEQAFAVDVAAANDAPMITSSPVVTATEGAPYAYDVEASDPDIGDALEYTLPLAPAGATIDPASGLIAWTPTGVQLGLRSFVVRATDLGGLFAEQAFDVDVAAANAAPAITSSPVVTATEGVPYAYDVDASDPDAGDALEYTLPLAPAGATIDPASGLIAWTPTGVQLGLQPFVVRATDLGGLFAEQAFDVDVAAANAAPMITSSPVVTATEGLLYAYDVDASDPDAGDVLEYTLPLAPAGATIDPASGLISWTPSAAQTGLQPFVVRATDLGGLFDEQPFDVDVAAAPSNQPPVFSTIPPTYALASSFYSYSAVATDPEQGEIAYTLEVAPADATVDPFWGSVYWFPTPATLGDHAFTLRATDAGGLFVEQSWTLHIVAPGNNPPEIISIPPALALAEASFEYFPSAFDVDPGDFVTWSLISGPTGVFFDSWGYLSWYPEPSQAGPHDFTIRATDSTGLFDDQNFTVEVVLNTPPTIVSTPPAGPVPSGATYIYAIVATDPDPNPSFSYWLFQGPPTAWIGSDGVLTWTVTPADAGTQSFTIEVSDPSGGTDSQSFDVEALPPVGSPPSIVSVPPNQLYSGYFQQYAVEVSDPDPGDTHTFALIGNLTTAAIDSLYGVFSWYPQSWEIGSHDFLVRVTDSEGYTAEQAFTIAVVEAFAPQIVSAPPLAATEAQPWSYDIQSIDANAGEPLVHTLELAPTGATIDPASGLIDWIPGRQQTGPHDFAVRVTDTVGLFDEQAFTVSVADIEQPPVITSTPPLTAASGAPMVYAVAWADPDSGAVDFSLPVAPAGAAVLPDGEIRWTPVAMQLGSQAFTVRVTDGGGAFGEQSFAIDVLDGSVPPPDPATIAPPLSETGVTVLSDAVAFLHEGPSPIQVGVVPGAIDPLRLCVLRGRVLDTTGAPLAQVIVRAHGHGEFGTTRTRADGAFDLVVNGGEQVVVEFLLAGHLPAQRAVRTPWQDYLTLETVHLVALDPVVTAVDLAQPVQVARGSAVTDADGTRTSTTIFPTGTTATLVLPDGTTQALTSLSFRATEYTVGAGGPRAMPADLPASSAYTYCVELGVDEAIAAGATRVEFNQPVFHYVENFLGFPVGSIVPNGSYDREAAVWRGEPNGTVIEVLGVDGSGFAELDVDGSGLSADAAALAALGFTDVERTELASLYTVGQQLWRVPIPHLTPYDHNWPFGPPPDAEYPGEPDPAAPGEPPVRRNEKEKDPCEGEGSIIDWTNQILGEEVPIPGTPFALRYSSDRVPGRRSELGFDLRVTNSIVPASLIEARVVVEIAGRREEQSFSDSPGQSMTFQWDRLDAYGRPVLGAMQARVTVTHGYPIEYYPPSEIGQAWGGFSFAGSGIANGRSPVSLSRTFEVPLSSWDASVQLGGWTPTVLHAYDPIGRTLVEGSGEERSAASIGEAVELFAGNGEYLTTAPDGPDSQQSAFSLVYALKADAEGGLIVPTPLDASIKRIRPDRSFETIAGLPGLQTLNSGLTGDGGPATEAKIRLFDLSIDGRGAIVFSTWGSFHEGGGSGTTYHAIRRIDPDGIITTIAGGVGLPNPGQVVWGAPAVGNSIRNPQEIAVGPDGIVYFTSYYGGYVHAVMPDGTLQRVTDRYFSAVLDLEVDARGDLYVLGHQSGEFSPRIHRLGSGGWSVIAGSGTADGDVVDGILAVDMLLAGAEDIEFDHRNRLHWIDTAGPQQFGWQNIMPHRRIRRLEPGGTVRTVAGRMEAVPTLPQDGIAIRGLGGLARDVWLPAGGIGNSGDQFTFGPDGTLFIENQFEHRILRAGPALPGSDGASHAIAAADGHQVFLFAPGGRHLSTIETNTRATLHTFGYDTEGRVTSVTDRNGRVTDIVRDPSGLATSIVAPNGETTVLGYDPNGFLSTITLPGARTYSSTYTADGLLTGFTWPGGHASSYGYDADGRLVSATNDTGMAQTLARTELPNGHQVVHTTAEGRVTTLRVERLPDRVRRTRIDPAGDTTVFERFPDGRELLTNADGTTVEQTTVSDPRFGPQVLLMDSLTTTTPGGATTSVLREREVTLDDPDDPLSLALLVDTITIDGETYVHTVDPIAGTAQSVSPEGREVLETFDALGRRTGRSSDAALAPLAITYDGEGRPSAIGSGSLGVTYGYDSQGRLATRLYDGGAQFDYAYDTAGNPIEAVLPSGRTYQYAYDADGNRTSLVQPGGQVHGFGFDARGRLTSYTAPGSAPWTRSYDLDGALESETLPSGRVRDHIFDAAGRLAMQVTSEATVTFGYTPSSGVPCCGGSGRTSALLRTPAGGTGAQSTTLSYDGGLLVSADHAGVALGTFTYDYDPGGELLGIALDGAPIVGLARDADGLLIGIGPYALTNGGPDGTTSALDSGGHSVSLLRDAHGRIVRRTSAVAGTVLYDVEISFDGNGRVASWTETAAGVTSTRVFGYDADLQLIEVLRDGTLAESYAYDLNANRTSAAIGGTPVPSTFDAQDRLVQLGSVPYGFDADGMLFARGGDGFAYGSFGETLSATVSGVTVVYTSDALGRRVARTVGGDTWQYLYGNPSDPWQVTASRDPLGLLTVYLYDEEGTLLAIERSGVRYAVLCDPVGSPRFVVDPSGTVVKTLEYTAYGVRTLDSAPGFELAIGFAGGLDDPDTGLVRFGLRDYDPAAGRFTTKDPLLFAGGQGNLYAYCGNDPIGRTDRSGLFSIGLSAYGGVGGGAKVSWEKGKGFSACFEVGFGLGSELEVDLDGQVDGNKDSINAELGVEWGPIGTEAKWELDDCGRISGDVGGKVGPVEVTMDGKDQTTWDPSDLADSLKDFAKGALTGSKQVQGKLAATSCRSFGN